MRKSRRIAAAGLVVGWLAAAPLAVAQATYSVSHAFTLSPTGGVTDQPFYVANTSALATPGGTSNVNNGTFTFGFGGGTSTWTASSAGPLSTGTAQSSATISPFALGGSISGVYTSSGSSDAMPGGACCVISDAQLNFGRRHPLFKVTGNGVLIPTWHMFPSTSEPSYESTADPWDFQVTDLKTGLVTTGTLYGASAHIAGPGSFSWASGVFSLNAQNFTFSIDINSPYTVQQGTADLQVTNGIITVSNATGMFAGIFPGIGSSGTFTVPFNNDFSLDYNLGNFNGDPVAVQFMISNGGVACIVPEPSSLLLLGAGMLSLAGPMRRKLHR